MLVGARQVGLHISLTPDHLRFLCTTISWVYREWSEKREHFHCVALPWAKVLSCCQRSEKNSQTDWGDRKATVNYHIQNVQNVKSISEWTTCQPIKQMETTWGYTPECYEQETAATVCMDSPELDNRRLGCCLVWWDSICAVIFGKGTVW